LKNPKIILFAMAAFIGEMVGRYTYCGGKSIAPTAEKQNNLQFSNICAYKIKQEK
jgi:hypothetical protein